MDALQEGLEFFCLESWKCEDLWGPSTPRNSCGYLEEMP